MRDAMGRGSARSAKEPPAKAKEEPATLEVSDSELEAEGMEDMEGMHLVEEGDEEVSEEEDA